MSRKATPVYGQTDHHKRPKSETVLSTWLRVNGKSRFALAREIGCDPKMVGYWADGRSLPSLIFAFKLERATNGGVPLESWLATEIGRLQWNNNRRNWSRWMEQRREGQRRRRLNGQAAQTG